MRSAEEVNPSGLSVDVNGTSRRHSLGKSSRRLGRGVEDMTGGLVDDIDELSLSCPFL